MHKCFIICLHRSQYKYANKGKYQTWTYCTKLECCTISLYHRTLYQGGQGGRTPYSKRVIQNWFTKLWRTKWIPLPSRFTRTININSKTKRITQQIMGGPHAELLWEIRTVLHCPPGLAVHWMQVKAHREREAVLVHKVLNDAVGELTHKVHDDPDWQARVKRWSTGTCLHHCTSGTKHWWDMSHRELWKRYLMIIQYGTLQATVQATWHPREKLTKKYNYSLEIFSNIDWAAIGTVFRGMLPVDHIQLFKLSRRLLWIIQRPIQPHPRYQSRKQGGTRCMYHHQLSYDPHPQYRRRHQHYPSVDTYPVLLSPSQSFDS